MEGDLQQKANELLESWLNGNRKDVMKELGYMSSMRAACISALIVKGLMLYPSPDEDNLYQIRVWEERTDDFIRMMKRRLE